MVIIEVYSRTTNRGNLMFHLEHSRFHSRTSGISDFDDLSDRRFLATSRANLNVLGLTKLSRVVRDTLAETEWFLFDRYEVNI